LPGDPVGADLERRDRYIGVNNLHAEPILRRAVLIVEDDRAGDTAWDDRPAHVDDTNGERSEFAEYVLEQVQMVLWFRATVRAFVDNLLWVSNLYEQVTDILSDIYKEREDLKT
jgi:hypothetical protein